MNTQFAPKICVILLAIAPFCPTEDFLQYIKQVENGMKYGFRDGRFYAYPSPEGGTDTIGYGHKLLPGESYPLGWSEDEATSRLLVDLSNAWNRAQKDLQKMGYDVSTLTETQKEIYVDFAFNLGSLRGFPKFTKLVYYNQPFGEEYKRYYKSNGVYKPLKDRNKRFIQRYGCIE